MKNLWFVFMMSMLTLSASAQKVKESEVPVSVKSAFENLYPGIKVSTWEKEIFNNYNAEFKSNGKDQYATFNPNGLLMRTAERISINEVNDKIKKHARELYPEHTLTDAIKVITVDKKIFFQLEMKNGKEEKQLVFQESGNFMGEDIYETMNK